MKSMGDFSWFSEPELRIIIFCDAVVIVCCETHATTKVLPSLKQKEMLITCVVFYLQLYCLRNIRLPQGLAEFNKVSIIYFALHEMENPY